MTRRLDIQYRMHEAIMNFSSLEFYEADLEADASVRNHLLSDLPGVTANALTEAAVTFIDTAGASYDEQPEPDGKAGSIRSKLHLVARKVRGTD